MGLTDITTGASRHTRWRPYLLAVVWQARHAAGRDATLMRRLADERRLSRQDLARTSAEARALMQSWGDAGWLHGL